MSTENELPPALNPDPSGSDQPPARDVLERRALLRRLASMTLLTAGLLKFAAPAQGLQTGGQQDPTCFVLQQDGSRSADEDCGTAADPIDNDCGKGPVAVPAGGRHSDNNCKPSSAAGDADCAKSVSGGWQVHSDNHCKPGSFDASCGKATMSSSSEAGKDNDCGPTSSDQDCGRLTYASGIGEAHTDNDGGEGHCGYVGSSGESHSDSLCQATRIDYDCGKGAVYAQKDSDCGLGNTTDADCGKPGSGGAPSPDNDCIPAGNFGDLSNTPSDPNEPAPPLPPLP